MDSDRPMRIGAQSFVGLLVIGVGVLFTLDNLGLVQWDRSLLRYWPAGLIALGVAKLWQAREGGHGAFGGFLFTLAGSWLLLEQTTRVRVDFADLWPLMLVFFGAYLVWQGVTGPRPKAGTDGSATLHGAAILGGLARKSNSPAFTGGSLTAIMGGCEIDLRQASIEREAVIDVFAWWGGIEIKVPHDWTVVSHVVPVLGGFVDSTRPAQPAPKRLIVRGVVVMAGVEVKN